MLAEGSQPKKRGPLGRWVMLAIHGLVVILAVLCVLSVLHGATGALISGFLLPAPVAPGDRLAKGWLYWLEFWRKD
ncbi:MAG TPA: hypothetical protein VHS06_11935 [Chloroflexota bacterium]|nr:hypothetical protein [Chloroflexota bacterium]